MNKNINIYKPCTILENNEKVIEKYNDSNSHFIRILLTVPADGIVTFSDNLILKDYSYIYWGDGTRGRNYSHTYTEKSGLCGKDVYITIADVTEITGCYFDIGTAKNVTKEMYFGKGVLINLSGPGSAPSLKKLLNISNTTINMLGVSFPSAQLEEITLNPDCLILKQESISDQNLNYLDCSNVLFFELNCFLHTDINTIVLGKNFIEPEVWGGSQFLNCFYEGSKEDYNNNNYSISSEKLYYYSEKEPFDNDNYWHWVKGKPVIWE